MKTQIILTNHRNGLPIPVGLNGILASPQHGFLPIKLEISGNILKKKEKKKLYLVAKSLQVQEIK